MTVTLSPGFAGVSLVDADTFLLEAASVEAAEAAFFLLFAVLFLDLIVLDVFACSSSSPIGMSNSPSSKSSITLSSNSEPISFCAVSDPGFCLGKESVSVNSVTVFSFSFVAAILLRGFLVTGFLAACFFDESVSVTSLDAAATSVAFALSMGVGLLLRVFLATGFLAARFFVALGFLAVVSVDSDGAALLVAASPWSSPGFDFSIAAKRSSSASSSTTSR
mmetsp:Transcript_9139/g.23151  ORF Transcript_9139/g.23151 Transcript_9139/m.23151 type:complete len:221 (-) Transcript_9139:1933-2595(-)